MAKTGLVICGCLVLAACNLMFSAGYGQQTIFNVPSADVTPKGQVFLEHDSLFRPWDGNDAYWQGTHYTALGTGYNTELEVTLFNVATPPSDNIALGVGFKSVIPLMAGRYPKHELKLTVGEMIPVSLEGKDVGNWTYGHVSFRLPRLKTRFTAGVQTATRQIFGQPVTGFAGGIEQPLTKRLNVAIDWFTGTHGAGVMVPGVCYRFFRQGTVCAAYQLSDRDSPEDIPSGFLLELSVLL